jgi:hypothetical protein
MEAPVGRLRARAALLVLLLAGMTSTAQAATRLPSLATGARKLAVRPAAFPYANGRTAYLGGLDGTGRGGRYGHLRWTSWSASRATASGAVWLYSCRPGCRFRSYRATARAFRPRSGHFTRLTIVYHYGGLKVTDSREIDRVGKKWVYVELSLLAD